MEANGKGKAIIIRTDNGLTLAGTRITLYDVMDYVTAGWPPKLIRDRLNLSDDQIAVVMDYIQTHQAEVEAEYQEVLQIAEENRQYWEERNRERLTEIASRTPTPAQADVRARIQELERKNKTPA